MSYQVLARKWRPRSFSEMVGQEAILRILENSLTHARVHHAYLFTGTRGVGKTTLARIFTKCLNCEKGLSATPCNTCGVCLAIDQGKFLDLYEVDGASRTKVEDTRELLENVSYPPIMGRYKVYLIDEVHMLSNHSFNALLKTLEEPPAHVKFLFATTDPKKLPVTILSRCLQFHLKCISQSLITNHLAHICNHESISFEETALNRLAYAAEGSLRDALSLLDQAIAFDNRTISNKTIDAMLGHVALEELFPLFDQLIQGNGEQLMALIQALAENGPNFNQIIEEVIHLLHQIALAQVVPTKSTLTIVQSLATKMRPEDVQIYYQIALLGRRDLAYTPSPQQGFEMIWLRMLAFTVETAKPKLMLDKKDCQAKPTPEPSSSKAALVEWQTLLPKLGLSGMAYALASNCCLENHQDNKMTLLLAKSHQPMLTTHLKEKINEQLNLHFKEKLQLEIKISEKDLLTPHKFRQDEETKKISDGTAHLIADPKIKQLLDLYDATLEVSIAT